MLKTIGRQTLSLANVGIPVTLLVLLGAGGAHAFSAPAAGRMSSRAPSP